MAFLYPQVSKNAPVSMLISKYSSYALLDGSRYTKACLTLGEDAAARVSSPLTKYERTSPLTREANEKHPGRI